MELPENIILEILSILPAKSIFKCRSVCKTWLRLLSDPYFSNLHSSKSPIEFLLEGTYPKTLLLAELDESPSTSNCVVDFHVGRKFIIDLNTHNNNERNQMKVCSSLDGLICLREKRTNSYCVYNPITGENVVVPHKGLGGFESIGCWLGLSAKSNGYKLLQFVRGTSVEAFVHTLGGKSWRSIALIPSNMNLKSSYAPFVNGALHWISTTRGFDLIGNRSALIFSFDFQEEKFEEVPAPSDYYSRVQVDLYFGKPLPYVCCPIGLGVLGGCLSLCYCLHLKGVVEIWVMNEYGIEESWTYLFVIPHVVNARSYQPIRFMGNGEILVLCDNRTLVSYKYNPTNTRIRYIKFYGINAKQRYYITLHVPSFVKVLK